MNAYLVHEGVRFVSILCLSFVDCPGVCVFWSSCSFPPQAFVLLELVLMSFVCFFVCSFS